MGDFRNYSEKQMEDKEFREEWQKSETGNANPALSALMRLAEGMGMVLRLEFVPK